MAKPTNCPPAATKKPTNGPPATKKPVNSPPVIKKTKTVKPEPVPDEKKDEKGSSSWFSWGHWLKWQKKVYPMKLPDDRNPTIIWDATKGCWVDTGK